MATRIKLTMAAFHGPFPEYDGNADDWEVYTYRLKQYFTANDIREDKKQRAILLSACGSETLKLIQSLISMDELETKKFDEIADAVQKHYHPKPSEIVSRFQFNSCSRNTGESVASFVARLRNCPSTATTAHHSNRCYATAWFVESGMKECSVLY